MIIADTSGLLALYNRREPSHQRVAESIASSTATIVVSPYVIAELDYLAATRLGIDAELAILRELSGGAYELAGLDNSELRACSDLVDRYRDQEIRVTDASLVVLAHRYRTRSVLSLDRKHFEVVRPLDGGRFELMPDRLG